MIKSSWSNVQEYVCQVLQLLPTYQCWSITVALPKNKEKKSELVPTYKTNNLAMLTKQQIDETIQLLTREKVAPEEKKAVEAGFVTVGQDEKFRSGIHSN